MLSAHGGVAVMTDPTYSPSGLGDVGRVRVLDLRAAVSVVQQPVSQAAPLGGTASFTFSVTTSTPPAFLWRRNGVPIADGPSGTGSSYSGATSATLQVVGVASADQFAGFDCVVTNGLGWPTSSTAYLAVQTGGGAGCRADLGQGGGLPGADGQLNNNDFIVFIEYFLSYTGCP
ncbi:MAG: immunoglobulin domain-containing protein [Chloroflexi bacterium]|nr:immunoglobulin domain-containing protein [Chloroflexota bacterium]